MNNTEPDYPAANPGPDPLPLPYQDVPALPPAVPQPVLYLPVKGPYPYNTMVVVHSYTVAEPSWFPILDDSVYRYSDLYQTGFRFPGYDPRTASQIAYQHSTIASLRTLQLSTHDQYTAAVDQVDDAFFDDSRSVDHQAQYRPSNRPHRGRLRPPALRRRNLELDPVLPSSATEPGSAASSRAAIAASTSFETNDSLAGQRSSWLIFPGKSR